MSSSVFSGLNNNLKNSNRGSFTIEGALVISAVLLVLCLLIFSFMFLYQKAVLTKTASYVAQQGAEIWADSRKVVENGHYDSTQSRDGLYYHIFDDSLLSHRKSTEKINSSGDIDVLVKKYKSVGREQIQEKKFAEIKRGICIELKRALLKPELTEVTINFSNQLIQRKIEVNLKQEIKIPLGQLNRFFGGKSTLTVQGKGIGTVAEPAEYIRNVDLGIEYASRAGAVTDIGGIIDLIKGRVGGK
ncbi:MAG: hypothetical protein N2484_13420 [Clostridia bacterium]|nr:hypothetical protein [Clostridia bacterium]